MKKLFVVSDVHSFYTELMSALQSAGFEMDNEEHIFVSCGDLLDRGPDAKKCLEFVNSLPDYRKILIRGNHEELADDMIRTGFFQATDYLNCTADTAQQLSEYAGNPYAVSEEEIIDSFSNNAEWQKYFQSTVYYKEIGNYIFTHGWIPCRPYYSSYEYDPEWRDHSFFQATWYNGMHMWNIGIREPGKTIVCGHWNTSWGHVNLHHLEPKCLTKHELFSTFKDDGIICLDSTVAYSRFLNVEVVEVSSDVEI